MVFSLTSDQPRHINNSWHRFEIPFQWNFFHFKQNLLLKKYIIFMCYENNFFSTLIERVLIRKGKS